MSSSMTSPSRKKRKQSSNNKIPPNSTFVWARDGTGAGAQEHPAYLLSSPPPSSLTNCESDDGTNDDNFDNDSSTNSNDSELVWVQWASNGTVSRIPKSNVTSTELSSRRRRSRRISRNEAAAAVTNNNSGNSSSPAASSANEDMDSTDKPPRSNNERTKKRSRLSLTRKQRVHFKEHHNHHSGKLEEKGQRKEEQQEIEDGDISPSAMTDEGSIQTTNNAVAAGELLNRQNGNDKDEREVVVQQEQPLLTIGHHQVEHSSAVDGWSCRKCTYFHKYGSRQCVMCGAPRVGTNQLNGQQHQVKNGAAKVSLSPQGVRKDDRKRSSTQQSSPEIVVIGDSDDEGKEGKKANNNRGHDQTNNSVLFSQIGSKRKSMPEFQERRRKGQLQVHIPASSSEGTRPHSPNPSYTHRSSAYVQHLAEACTLIMTDARWHTVHNGCDQQKPLFSLERGDDLSAVEAFMSLYDEPSSKGDSKMDAESNNDVERTTGPKKGGMESKEQGNAIFERTMHLYSRMFHRKGPWFDLADLYVRYYAPKSTNMERDESVEQGEVALVSSESTDSDGVAKADKANEKIKDFFTPRSAWACGKITHFNSTGKDSSKSRNRSNQLLSHQTSLERLFQDILRLLSMGLIRTFQSEYECGSVAGSVTAGGRRGTILSADERRDVLRRLGWGKSPKVARAATTFNNTSDGGGTQRRNEILRQMQSQQTVLSSLFQSQKGGVGKAKASMLPVIKHVDKVLIQKLAVKVATLAFNEPRKAEIEEVTHMIHRAWTAACASIDNAAHIPNGITCTFRLREAPLETLRRCMRLFLCAGGGPGAMRGDGANGWISVLGEDGSSSADPSSSASSSWHNVSYPGLSSQLGLEHYELGHCYNPMPLTSHSMLLEWEEEDNSTLSSTAMSPMTAVFTRYCEFQLWELGVEMRSFIDRCTEAYESETMARRRREKELSKLESCEVEIKQSGSVDDGKAPTIPLFDFDGSALLTEEGRKKLVRSIMIPIFSEGELSKHATLDLALFDLCHQIEADILLMSNNTTDEHGDGSDGFVSDIERMMAAKAVICNRILQLRIKYPSALLTSLVKRPWLRHMCFDAILTYILWDAVPILERRGHHLMAVSILQTILFGYAVCEFSQSGNANGELFETSALDNMKVKSCVLCLLPRRNRGKAYERLLIDTTHSDRRHRKEAEAEKEPKKKKTGKSSSNDTGSANKGKQQSAIQTLCKALLRNAESLGSIPFCSLRNLARRSKEPLPQTDERSILKIRQTDDGNWSPKTDSAVANAISSDSDESTAGKRCAFVGWELNDGQAETVEAKRSLNVEELALEEYHFGRLPCNAEEEDTEEVNGGGGWVGWHSEGSHVRALFRIVCLQHLLSEHCPQDKQWLDEQTTVFLTPYQTSPHDLHVGRFKVDDAQSGCSPIRGFYERRRSAIESFLTTLSQMDACAVSELVFEAVKKRWERHVDDRSRLKDPRLLKDVAELKTLSMIVAGALGPTALARLFRTLCYDYRHWSGGLPDLLLVRARYASGESGDSDSFVDLSDWIGEGFCKQHIEEKNMQSNISMLLDRDDEFLGCSKNADGSSSQQQRFTRKKQQGAAKVELPSFPPKLTFIHEEKKVKPEAMFVEVKSANDRLSERQEDWLSILESCTNARVCKFNSSSNK